MSVQAQQQPAARPSSTAALGIECPSVIEAREALAACQIAPHGRVGEVSDRELELHIQDCGNRMVEAHKAGNRLEAEGWRAAMYAAIGARSPAAQAARHAEFERRLDEGVDYFAVQGLEAAKRLGRNA